MMGSSSSSQQKNKTSDATATAGATSSATASTTGDTTSSIGWVDRIEEQLKSSDIRFHGQFENNAVRQVKPVGKEFFKAVRYEWRCKKPVQADGSGGVKPVGCQMDPDDIIDAIEETPGDILDPPVHLPYMIDCLTEVWEDEGLYD